MHKNRNKIARLVLSGVVASQFISPLGFKAEEATQASQQQDSQQDPASQNSNQSPQQAPLQASGQEGVDWTYSEGVLTILPGSDPITLSGSSATDRIEVSPEYNGELTLAGVEINSAIDASNSNVIIAADTVNKITSTDPEVSHALKCTSIKGQNSNAQLVISSAKSGIKVTEFAESVTLDITATETGLETVALRGVDLNCEANVCVYAVCGPYDYIKDCNMNLVAKDTGIKAKGELCISGGLYNITAINGVLGEDGEVRVSPKEIHLNCDNIGIGSLEEVKEIYVGAAQVFNEKECNAIIGTSSSKQPTIFLLGTTVTSAKPVTVGIGYLAQPSGEAGYIHVRQCNINLSSVKVGIGSSIAPESPRVLIGRSTLDITATDLGVTGDVNFEDKSKAIINAEVTADYVPRDSIVIVNRGTNPVNYEINDNAVILKGDYEVSADNLTINIGEGLKLITDNLTVVKEVEERLSNNGFLEINQGCVLTNHSRVVNEGTIYGKVVGDGFVVGKGEVIERDYSKNQAPSKPGMNVIIKDHKVDSKGQVLVEFELVPSVDPEGDAIEYTYEGPHTNGYYAPGDYTVKVYATDCHGTKSAVFEKTFTVPDMRVPLEKPEFTVEVTDEYNENGECLVHFFPLVSLPNGATYEVEGGDENGDNYFAPGHHIIKVRAVGPNNLPSDWVRLEFDIPEQAKPDPNPPEVTKPSTPEIKAELTEDYDSKGNLLVNIVISKPSDGKGVTYEYVGKSADNRYAPGKHTVKVRAIDENKTYSDWFDLEFTVPKENKAPTRPELTVAITDKYNEKGECLVKVVLAKPATDPEGDKITYEYSGYGVGSYYIKPGSYTSGVRAVDEKGKASEWYRLMYVVPEEAKPDKPSISITTHEALIGSDRYDTANKIVKKEKTDKLIVFNASKSIVDGLSASALAGKLDANILPINPNKLNQESLKLIRDAKEVYIMGLYDAVPRSFESNIRGKVVRIGGKDRYETSKRVADYIGYYRKAFLVNGDVGQADAMSVASVAVRSVTPILLVNNNSNIFTPQSNVKYTAIGGRDVMPSVYVNRFNANRLGGDDRYETNRRVLEAYYRPQDKIYFCNGETLVDALSGSYLARDHGIVLVNARTNHFLLNGKNTVQLGGMNFKVDPR